MTCGVIYGLTGPSHAELFAVSIWSLRQHYDGPVCLFLTDDSREIGNQIAADKRLGLQVARTERLDDNPRPHWVTKSMLYLQSPYDQTVYLDGDTIVLTDPAPMFNGDLVFAITKCRGVDIRLKDTHPYSVSLWKQVRKFRKFGPIMKYLVKDAEQRNGYAANNGVLGFRKHHPALWEIHHLAVGFRKERLHDEIATQMVLPRHVDNIRHVPGKWNALARYEDDWDNASIVHLHRGSHLAVWKQWGGSRGRDLWMGHFREAWESNAGNLRQWGGKGDPALLEVIKKWK